MENLIEVIERIKSDINGGLYGDIDLSGIDIKDGIKLKQKIQFCLSGIGEDRMSFDDRVNLYKNFIIIEIINLVQQIGISCVYGEDMEIEDMEIEDKYIGNIYDNNLNRLNKYSYISENNKGIDYGIRINEGFIDMSSSIKTLEIDIEDELIKFKIELNMTESFDLSKIR